jgi:hypothetical protein
VRFVAWAEKERASDTQTVTIGRDSARLIIMALFLSTGFVSELLLNLIDLKTQNK